MSSHDEGFEIVYIPRSQRLARSSHTTMSPTVSTSFGHFLQSLSAIAASLVNSVTAVLMAILALGQDICGSVLKLGQSTLKLALDVFQGVFGFVAGTSGLTVISYHDH